MDCNHPATQPLHQHGILPGFTELLATGMGIAQDVWSEGHGHLGQSETVTPYRYEGSSLVDLLDDIGDGENRHRGVGAGFYGLDHQIEDRLMGQGVSRVVHDYHTRIGWDQGKAGLDRVEPGWPTLGHRIDLGAVPGQIGWYYHDDIERGPFRGVDRNVYEPPAPRQLEELLVASEPGTRPGPEDDGGHRS